MLILQLLLFVWVVCIRGPRLFGRHLKPVKGSLDCLRRDLYLYYVSNTQVRECYAVHVGVEIKGNLIPFVVRRERWYHRYLKRVGLAHEISIPDAEFDRKYYVTTDFPNHLEDLMADGPLLSDVRTLMDKQVKAVHVGLRRVWCVLADKDHKLTEQGLEPFYEQMRRIGVAAQTDAHRPKRHHMLWAVSAFLAVHVALFVCGIAGLLGFADGVDVIDGRYVLGYGLLAGVFGVIIWQFLAIAVFKGTSWLGWVLVDFWIWGIVGMLLLGPELLRTLNQEMPQQPAVIKQQTVLRKECVVHCYQKCGRRCSRTRNYRYVGENSCKPEVRPMVLQHHKDDSDICRSQAYFQYEVIAQSWRKGEENFSYRARTSEQVFDNVHERGTVRIPVHSGALGFEWVDPQNVRP